MKLIVCAVMDKKVAAYAQPHYFRSKGEAIRSFTDAVRDKSSQFCKHPEDYVFMQLGFFDDQTGIFDSSPSTVQPLLTALEAVEPAV